MKILKNRRVACLAASVVLCAVTALLPMHGALPAAVAASAADFNGAENESRNWEQSEGWRFLDLDGNTVVEGIGHNTVVLKGYDRADIILKARLKLQSGAIHINFRHGVDASGLHRYFLGINENDIYLYKQEGDRFDEFIRAPLEFGDGWHDIELVACQGVINFYIDGVLSLLFNDADPLRFSGIAFEVLENTVCYLDAVGIADAKPEDAIAEISPGQKLEVAQRIVADQTHTGNLILSGTETMIIENENFFQQGNIYINDHAKLILRNSRLMIGRGDVPTIHVYINIADNAALEIEDSAIYARNAPGDDMGALICVRNSGTVTMTNSPTQIHLFENYPGADFDMTRSEMVNPLGGLLQVAGGSITLTDSTIGALGLTIPANADCTVSGLTSGAFFDFWDVHYIIPDADYSLILVNSSILEDDLEGGGYERGWIFFPDADSNASFSDSQLRKVFFNIHGDTASFDDLVLNRPSGLQYRNIRLSNVVIQGEWSFSITDSDVTFCDSDFLFLQPEGNSSLTLINSNIIELIPREFSGEIRFDNSTWNSAGEFIGGKSYHSMSNDFTITGGLKIGNDLKLHLQWQDARVTREYDVWATDGSGAALSGLDVRIGDQSFPTDADGKATFRLDFDETNYKTAQTLEAYDGERLLFQKEIDFFTETPVIMAEDTTAVFFTAEVLVNGNPADLKTCRILGCAYCTLPGLAGVLNGTEKRFSMTRKEEMDIIRLTAGEAFTSVEGGVAASAGQAESPAKRTESCVFLNAALEKLTVYNVGGTDYYALDELAEIMCFSATSDMDANVILIETPQMD